MIINLSFKSDSLVDLSWIAVDEEALRGREVGQHGVLDHLEHDVVRDQLTLLHGLVEALTALRARFHLGAEQVTARQVRQTVLVNQLGALSSLKKKRKFDNLIKPQLLIGVGKKKKNANLSTAWTTDNKNDLSVVEWRIVDFKKQLKHTYSSHI
jgi:hypothetical protein